MKVCPQCHARYPEEYNHCPHDGATLCAEEKESFVNESSSIAKAPQGEADVVSLTETGGTLPQAIPNGKSYFDGKLIQLIGWTLLGSLLTCITLGILYPFALCWTKAWRYKHSVVNGYRLHFDGDGAQLIGRWILWIFLSIITLLVFAWFVPMKVIKWELSHVSMRLER